MNARPLLESIVVALAGVRLEAILIGNAAAAIQGAPVTTVDFDFMFRATPVNLAKLKRFARRMDATIFRPYYPASALYRVINDDRGLQADFMPVIHGVKSFNSLRSRAGKIELGDPPQLQLTNALTIEGWVRPVPHTNLLTQQIFFRGDSRNCLDPYYLSLEPVGSPATYRLHFHIDEAGSRDCGVDVVAELPEDYIRAFQWHHVAAVFESTVLWTANPPWPTNELRLFVDGRRVTNLFVNGSGPLANAYTDKSPPRDLDSGFSPGVAIGNRSRYDNSQPFRGGIDELTVYGRALTDP